MNHLCFMFYSIHRLYSTWLTRKRGNEGDDRELKVYTGSAVLTVTGFMLFSEAKKVILFPLTVCLRIQFTVK